VSRVAIALAILALVPALLGAAGAECRTERQALRDAERSLAAARRALTAAEDLAEGREALRTSAGRALRSHDALDRDPGAMAEQETCATAIHGEQSDAARARAIRSGPLAIVGLEQLRGLTRAQASPRRLWKGIVLLREGAQATLRVAADQRADVVLVYTNRPSPAVRFTACEQAETMFNGGVVVAEPLCLELDVLSAGLVERVRVAIGAPC
jgi:hypothetical protein